MRKIICTLFIYLLLIFTNIKLISTSSSSTLTCPDPLKPCGNKVCYDPATHACTDTGSTVACIASCGDQCYNSKTHICIDNTICYIGEHICEVKYDAYFGNAIESSRLQCYNPQNYQCLNHTICHQKDRVCNEQCILYGRWVYNSWSSSYYEGEYRVCASDNRTVCTVPQRYNYYKPNQIQACNGTCYDIELGLQHCVNGSLQCIASCKGVCYNTTIHICVNDTICAQGQQACLTDYDSNYGTPITPSRVECYNPSSSKCVNRALCSKSRICNEQCITGSNARYQVCTNDKRTLCNVTNWFNNYRPYQMHLCDGHCYDTTIRQCVNGIISCIDDTCDNQCYNADNQVCINSSLCPIGNQICEIKYDYAGQLMTPSQLQCYDPKSQTCLNNTLCDSNRVCSNLCMMGYYSNNQVCADGVICTVQNHYTYYKPNQIKRCNNTCFDAGNPLLKHCVNGSVECISKCSHNCYNTATHNCFNNTLCQIDEKICHTYYESRCYNPSFYECLNDTICNKGYQLCYTGGCYDPSTQKCLNGIICSNDRICDEKCITDSYQVCANDKKTVCNVTKPYNNYQVNQIQLCLGVCYDSFVQQCTGDPSVICIEDPGNIICISQNFSSSTRTTNSVTPATSSNLITTATTSTSTKSSTISTSSPSSTTEMHVQSTSTSTTVSSTFKTISSTTMTSTVLTESVPPSTSSSPSTTVTYSQSTSTRETLFPTLPMTTTTLPVFNTSTGSAQTSSSSTTASTTSITPWLSTSSLPSSDSCCEKSECITDADCCIRPAECQCYRHNQTHGYGICLNPNVTPICSDGCLQTACSSDVDCCKCQCGTITVTDVYGQTIARKQCVRRQ